MSKKELAFREYPVRNIQLSENTIIDSNILHRMAYLKGYKKNSEMIIKRLKDISMEKLSKAPIKELLKIIREVNK